MVQCNACFKKITTFQEILWKVVYFKCPNSKVDSECTVLYYHIECFESFCVCTNLNSKKPSITSCRACGTDVVITINDERHRTVINHRKVVRRERKLKRKGTWRGFLDKSSSSIISFCTTYVCGMYSTRNYTGSPFDGYYYYSPKDDDNEGDEESSTFKRIEEDEESVILLTSDENKCGGRVDQIMGEPDLNSSSSLIYDPKDLKMNLYYEEDVSKYLKKYQLEELSSSNNNNNDKNEEKEARKKKLLILSSVPTSIKYKPCSNVLGFIISLIHKKCTKEWIDYNIFVDISNKDTLRLDYSAPSGRSQ
jgi:hypothetical protein